MIKTIFKNKIFSFKLDDINNIVFVNCISNDYSENDYENYHKVLLKIYEEFEKKKVKFCLIFDTTELGVNAVSYAKSEALFFNKLESRTKDIVTAICVITNSTIVKNSINFFINIFSSVIPYKIVYNIQEAFEFLKEHKKITI